MRAAPNAARAWFLVIVTLVAHGVALQAHAAGPLHVSSLNPRYFTDGSGKAIYLTGSHYWLVFQDAGTGYPPPVFDFTKYLSFMVANNHNFLRFWIWEQSRWVQESANNDFWFNPQTPYKRTGPGNALDGHLKFNLDSLGQTYFDRMRARIMQAGQSGIYCSIMLFDGWSVGDSHGGQKGLSNPWNAHPFNKSNNVNGINGDPNGDGSGFETQHLATGGGDGIPAITAYQLRYVQKVIRTVNDLDNVLFEISNESDPAAMAWEYMLIDSIKAFESRMPKQHPVGMTGDWWYNNSYPLKSGADWISPGAGPINGSLYETDPPASTGAKVIITDTDHLWGIGGDRAWVWKSFMRGLNPIFMDGYDGGYGTTTVGWDPSNPTWADIRVNMGYTRRYADRMNLIAMAPSATIASTGYCLARTAPHSAEYLVYVPVVGSSLSVDLSATADSLSVEWFNPATGGTQPGASVAGGGTRHFTPPSFAKDAVLYLKTIDPPTGVAPGPITLPGEFTLLQNFPNPFNPSTTLRFLLPSRMEVRITVYGMRGQQVRSLAPFAGRPGVNSVVWDARDDSGHVVTSGVYLYRVTAGGQSLAGKMVVIR